MSIKRNEKDGQKTGKMWTGGGKAEKKAGGAQGRLQDGS